MSRGWEGYGSRGLPQGPLCSQLGQGKGGAVLWLVESGLGEGS